MSPSRAGGIAGIAGWVLFFIAFIIDPTPPTLGAGAAEIVAHSESHQHMMMAAAFLFAAAAPLFLIWGAAVARLMRDHEGENGWLWLAFLSASGTGWAVDIAASFIWFALAGRGWKSGGSLVELQLDLVNYGYIFTGFGSLVLVATASLVMARTGMISKRLGQLGLVVAAIQVLYLITAFFATGPLAGGGPITIAGFTILGLWFLSVSIAMVVRPR